MSDTVDSIHSKEIFPTDTWRLSCFSPASTLFAMLRHRVWVGNTVDIVAILDVWLKETDVFVEYFGFDALSHIMAFDCFSVNFTNIVWFPKYFEQFIFEWLFCQLQTTIFAFRIRTRDKKNSRVRDHTKIYTFSEVKLAKKQFPRS